MFTKHALLFFPVTFLLIAFSSCKEKVVRGEGEVISQKRDVPAFKKVSVDMTVKADIEIGGDSCYVEVKAFDNLQEHIKTEVSDDKLRIFQKTSMTNFDDVSVVIHMPLIDDLEIHGAADANVKGRIEVDVFKLNVHGAADVNIERLDVKSLNVTLSGATEVNIRRGSVEEATYKVAGAGEIYADRVRTNKAEAKVSGAGEMSLFVTDTLNASISGAGEIDYNGNPHIISDIKGAGALNKR